MSTTDITTRPADAETIRRQIGRMNVLAISGGRTVQMVNTEGEEWFVEGLRLPVRYGHAVEVILAANDTYTVRHTFTRSGRTTVRREWTNVHADEVGEIAYTASCFRDA